MRTELLNGKTQFTHQIKQGADPQYLVIENMAVDAKLKAEIKKEIGSDVKLFNTINAAYLLEIQNKIQRYTVGGIMPEIHLHTVVDDAAANVLAVKLAKIDLAYGGEIQLAINETVDVFVSDLKKIADSTMHTFEGTAVSNFPYQVKERTFKKDEPQLKVDLKSTDFLVFDVNSIPAEIDFTVNGQKITRTREAILLDQKDKFNTVGFDENNAPIYGVYKAVVIDVRACSDVTLEDEADPRVDIKYHTVKTPYSNKSNK